MNGEESTFERFGRELREARESRNRSIDEIAEKTRINHKYIEAIENGDLTSLPSGPYTRAFLREYARVVGLVVPAELAEMTNTETSSSVVRIRKAGEKRPANVDIPQRNPQPSTRQLPRTQPTQSLNSQSLNSAIKVTKDTARFANQAAKTAARSAVKTTENVFKKVESGAKEAVDVFTSKSLWEEAEQVRRERRGLEPTTDVDQPQPSTGKTTKPPVDLDFESIKSSITAAESPNGFAKATAPQTTISNGIVAPTWGSNINEEYETQEASESEAETTSSKSKRSGRLPGTGLLSTTNLVILGVVIIFAVVIGYAIRQNENQQTPEAPLVAEQEIATEKPSVPQPKAVEPAKQPTQASAISPSDSLRFSLKATEPVWVSIAPDGRIPFRGMLKAGEVRSFAAQTKFVVNLGNQKALDMTFNGRGLSHLPTIANSGMVVRDLELTRDRVMLNGKSVTENGSPSTTPSNVVAASKTPNTAVSKNAIKAPAHATNTSSNTHKNPATKQTATDHSKKQATLDHPRTKAFATPAIKKPSTTSKSAKTKAASTKRFKSTIPPVETVPPRP
jgi:transcriptional regulator with XRE-family HTH domain